MSLFAVMVLAGCSTIHTYVEDFPQDLPIEYKVMEPGEVAAHCWQYLTTIQKLLLAIPLACAEIDLDAHRCTIIHYRDVAEWVMEHEEQHCRGGDHDGLLQAHFDEWLAERRQRVAVDDI